MQEMILTEGPPPLTQRAADAALDAIDFIAAAVRGYDAVEVTSIVRPIWRAHLVYWYPHLPQETREWYANAPQMLACMRAQWPLLDPWRRAATLQQWSMELPQMLWMLDPVLAEAQAVEMQQSHRAQLEDLRQEASRGQPATTDIEAQAIDELARRSQMTTRLQSYSTQMAYSTIDLMRAFNSHP